MIKNRRLSVLLTRLAIIFAILAVWEIAARFFVDPMFLSPPSAVLMAMPSLFARPGVASAFLLLLTELAVAFVGSILIGLSVGLAIGVSGFSRRSLMPIVLLLYATPQITILPIVMLLAGIGPASKIVFGITHGMFPVIITVVASLRDLKPVYRISSYSMGATAWQRFRYMLLPHMLSNFFTSMRLAMIASLLGVLLAELYASSRGIGFYTRQFTESFDPTSLFGLVAVTAAMVMILNSLLRRLEARFSPHKRLSRRNSSH